MVLHTLLSISKKWNISSEEDRGELIDHSHQKLGFNTPSAKLFVGEEMLRVLTHPNNVPNVAFGQEFFC